MLQLGELLVQVCNMDGGRLPLSLEAIEALPMVVDEVCIGEGLAMIIEEDPPRPVVLMNGFLGGVIGNPFMAPVSAPLSLPPLIEVVADPVAVIMA